MSYDANSMDSNGGESNQPSTDYVSFDNYDESGIRRFANLAPVAFVSTSNLSGYERSANARPIVAISAPTRNGGLTGLSLRQNTGPNYRSLTSPYTTGWVGRN